MKTIILTATSGESKKLYDRLIYLNPGFKQIPRFTRETICTPLDCEIVFSTWYMPKFSKEEINKFFPNLKAIFYAAGTVKQFAEPFLESGVRIFSAAKANGIPVAEYTAAQIVLANKGYFQAQRKYRWPLWRKKFGKIRSISESHSGNYNATIGILGCGAIGSTVIELLKPYNLKIKVYDPYLTEKRANELGIERTSLEEIFSTCNVISNHMPDTSETKGIINKTLLQSMVPYATFINTGRGAQIKENDLATILRIRKDLCALLDVTCHEPLFPWSKLYWRNNIFITPHIAGSLSNEIDRMIDFSYQAYLDYINDKTPIGEISLDDLKHNA